MVQAQVQHRFQRLACGGRFPWVGLHHYKAGGETVATVSKELLQWTDTYVLDIVDPADALHVLMFVLAIDAEKCSAK